MAIFRRRPPNEGVECRWGRYKSRLSANIWLHCVLWTVPPPSAIHLAATDRGKLCHLSLVSGRVCWWQETTTKCLWQEASTLRQRSSI